MFWLDTSLLPLAASITLVRVYVLQGDPTLLLWCCDKRNTWQTELREQQPPEALTGLTLDLSGLLPDRPVVSAQAYDPWDDRWTNVTLAGKTAPLPTFTRSIVVRLGLGR